MGLASIDSRTRCLAHIDLQTDDHKSICYGFPKVVAWNVNLVALQLASKTASTRLVLDFRPINSCIHHQPARPMNQELPLIALCPFKVGSIIDLSNACF